MLHSIVVYCTISYRTIYCSVCSMQHYNPLYCIFLHFHCIILYIVLFFVLYELCSLILNYCITFILFCLTLYFQTCLCRYFYDSCIFTQLRFNCAAAPVLDDDGYDFSVKNAAIDRESWREIRSNCKLMKFVNLQLSSPGNLFKAGAFRKDEFGGCTQVTSKEHMFLCNSISIP